MSGQRGFTLIELVVVVVILGILAATAAPRFIDVSEDAYIARVDALYGAVTSASDLVHMKAKISGDNDNIVIDSRGVAVALENGYPHETADGIIEAMDMTIVDSSSLPIAASDWYYMLVPNQGILISIGTQGQACGVLYQAALPDEKPQVIAHYAECAEF